MGVFCHHDCSFSGEAEDLSSLLSTLRHLRMREGDTTMLVVN